MDPTDDCSLEEAAVALGISPSSLERLLRTGQLSGHVGPDGRRTRLFNADLEAHREARFALRQRMVQEIRTRQWAEPDPDELAV